MDGAELEEFIDRYNAAWNDHDVDAIVSMSIRLVAPEGRNCTAIVLAATLPLFLIMIPGTR